MSEDKGKYVYTNKSKKLTFDLNELTDGEKKKFNKLNDTQKRQFIAAFKLNEEVQFPDEVQVKTTKEYTPNEKYNKLVITKSKSDELNKFVNNIKKYSPENLNTKIKDIKDVILKYTEHITADDLNEAINKNENMTISDLNKLYIDKVNELNISQAENVNISQANKVNFDKLLLDVNKLTKIIDDPLKNSLKEIVNKYSNNDEIIEAADKNDIAKLITELEKQRDTKLLDEIKDNIDFIIANIGNLFGDVEMTQDEILEILKNKDEVKELKEMINSEFKDMKDLIKINESLNEIMKETNKGTITHEQLENKLVPIIRNLLNDFGYNHGKGKEGISPDYIAFTDGERFRLDDPNNANNYIIPTTKNELLHVVQKANLLPDYKTSSTLDQRAKTIKTMLIQIKNILYPSQEGEGIKDFFKGVKNVSKINEIESMKNELLKINERLSKLEFNNTFQQPQQFPSSSTIITSQNEQPQPQKPEFLNSITQPVKLKPLDIEVDNGFKKTRQEEEQGILKDLSEIMSKRRQDLEPDDYSDYIDDDDEWAEGLRKKRFEGLKLYSLSDLLSHN